MDPLERAVQELSEQNYGSAIRSLEMLTAQDPTHADAYRHLSQAYFRTGDKAKAAEAAQRYAALRPTDASGHYNAGVLMLQLGQNEAAVRALRAALAADPGHAKARRALAKAEGLDEETGAPVLAAPAAVPAGPAEVERRKMPWQAKVAAALTVAAAVAIILALFLPDATLDPRLQPQPEGSTPVPPPTPTQPNPGTTAPSPAAPNPDAAREVLGPIERATKEQMYQQLRLVIGPLRDPNLQDPEFYEILKTATVTQSPTMAPGGLSMGSAEVLAVIAAANTGAEAADRLEQQAPSIIEASWSAFAAEAALALAQGTTAQQAQGLLLPLLRKYGITLGQPDMAQLQASVERHFAERAARGG
jgi:tetratricopeptide (TPR) repeat protein